MRKKTRILIAALSVLVVTTASTYAYFTSTTTINANGGGGNPLSLNITNGQVSITGQIGAGGTTPNWSYDVARVYDAAFITSLIPGTYANVAAYESANRSPDIVGVSATGRAVVNGLNRYAIGAAVTGDISQARPGDALVMGVAASNGTLAGDTTSSGLTVTNGSNLTVKVQYLVATNGAATDTITALNSAGWKMYVNGTEINTTNYNTIQASLDSAAVTLAAGGTTKINIRLELPLTTLDTKQSSVVSSGSVTSFDITKLISIKATQENNPGWTVSGT